jgi:homoserine kinase type II
MPGSANYEQAPSSEKLRAAMRALAQFHLAGIDFPIEQRNFSVGRQAESTTRQAGAVQYTTSPGTPSSIQRRRKRLQQLTDGGTEELSAAISLATWSELAPLARQFLAALPSALPHALAQIEQLMHVALPLQPCLRDVWHDHVLFTGNKVTGFVDFGAVDFDTPATDVARLLGSLIGDNHAGWQLGLSSYSTLRRLSKDEIRAVTALDISGTLLAGCNWIRWVYVERRHFENERKIVNRFATVLARLLCLRSNH